MVLRLSLLGIVPARRSCRGRRSRSSATRARSSTRSTSARRPTWDDLALRDRGRQRWPDRDRGGVRAGRRGARRPQRPAAGRGRRPRSRALVLFVGVSVARADGGAGGRRRRRALGGAATSRRRCSAWSSAVRPELARGRARATRWARSARAMLIEAVNGQMLGISRLVLLARHQPPDPERRSAGCTRAAARPTWRSSIAAVLAFVLVLPARHRVPRRHLRLRRDARVRDRAPVGDRAALPRARPAERLPGAAVGQGRQRHRCRCPRSLGALLVARRPGSA